MKNFFEKLKRGMGIEEEKEKIEFEEKRENKRKAKKIEIKKEPIKLEAKEIEGPGEVEVEEKKPEPPPPLVGSPEKKVKETWLEQEGQLALDIYQTENELVIQSAIAGVRPEDLEISIEKDILTIVGERRKPFEENGDYFSQECYWGRFSRQVILPVEIDPDKVEAILKEGILTIRMPKIQREKRRRITVKG